MLASGRTVAADAMILATGSRPVLPVFEGIDAKTILTYTRFEDIARLDRAIEGSGVAAVVGGGLVGTEVAEILHARRKPFTWFVRESGVYRSHLQQEESTMITSHIRSFGVNLHTGADGLDAGELEYCNPVIFCTGVMPRKELATTSHLACDTGIRVNERFETNVQGIYAIGDCAETPWGIDQRWHSGKEHGAHVARIVCGDTQPYRPSVFCNSAKFFDLEWQVFGNVPASGDGTIFKADPIAERSVRFACDESGALTGLQTVGVRLRQSVCEDWIRRAISVDEAMRNFAEASFDPEFARRFDV
jgi:NAD(P)H-nitrite reductase large subunit